MSLCVAFQTSERITVGADTAVTQTIDGKPHRSTESYVKLHEIGDYLVFISGTVGVSNKIVEEMRAEETKSIGRFQRIIKRWGEQLVAFDPQYVALMKQDSGTGGAYLTVALFRVLPDGGTVSYGISSKTGFRIEENEIRGDDIRIQVAGYKSEQATQYAIDLITSGVRAPETLIEKVFAKVSGDQIGGDCVIYTMDRSVITCKSRRPIPETLTVPIFEANASLTAGTITGIQLNGNTINGGTITGPLIQTTPNGIYPRVEISSSGNLFGAYYNAGNSIQITPNYAGAPAIVFNTAGSFAGHIHTLMGHLEIEGNGSITISGGPGGNVNLGGTINVDSWSSIKYGNISLQYELDQLSDSIESVRLNAAARGVSTGLAGSHNHGIAEGTRLAIWGPDNTVAGYVTWSPAPTHSHAQN
jgi:hypothetical protein